VNKLLSINTNRWVKKNNVVRSTTEYGQTQTIGILFCVEDKAKHEVIKAFIHRLENDNKKVEVLVYLPEKKENYDFLFDYFTKKDISFWGKYNSPKVLEFSSKSFDDLLHLDFDSQQITNGILALSKAKCRIGGANVEQNKFYEMIITTPTKNIKQLVDEMYKYISILN